MKKFFGALIAAVAAAALTAPAMAQDSTTAYAKVASSYVLQDLALEASAEPSLQAGVTQTYGKWSIDVWTATELSGKGQYGNRGYGDEVDICGIYNDTAETSFGKLTFEGSGCYYALSSFGETRDDMVQVYADVGLPIQVGPATITPFVRPIQWIGFGEIPNETLIRSGARFALPLEDGWSVDGDLSVNFLLTSNKEHGRGQVNLRKDFGGGWSGAFELKVTDGAPTVFAIGGSKTF